jgi:hypothetical protein
MSQAQRAGAGSRPGGRRAASSDRLRRCRCAAVATGKPCDHAAPSSHPYRRLHLWALGHRGVALRARDRQPIGARAGRVAARATDVRSRPALAIRPQPRLGGPHRRGISGERLDVYFRKHILDPLGMADTAFILSPTQQTREASTHRRKSEGTLQPEPLEKQTARTTFNGGGASIRPRRTISPCFGC